MHFAAHLNERLSIFTSTSSNAFFSRKLLLLEKVPEVSKANLSEAELVVPEELLDEAVVGLELQDYPRLFFRPLDL